MKTVSEKINMKIKKLLSNFYKLLEKIKEKFNWITIEL